MQLLLLAHECGSVDPGGHSARGWQDCLPVALWAKPCGSCSLWGARRRGSCGLALRLSALDPISTPSPAGWNKQGMLMDVFRIGLKHGFGLPGWDEHALLNSGFRMFLASGEQGRGLGRRLAG